VKEREAKKKLKRLPAKNRKSKGNSNRIVSSRRFSRQIVSLLPPRHCLLQRCPWLRHRLLVPRLCSPIPHWQLLLFQFLCVCVEQLIARLVNECCTKQNSLTLSLPHRPQIPELSALKLKTSRAKGENKEN
jgi:hypothetical protein